MKRQATINRKTRETDISLSLTLEGSGEASISTGIGFFDHLLEALAKHARFDLTVQAKGDLHVDGHHTVEDVGICLGQALDEALETRTGIERYGHAYCPLDEALARSVVDISGRGFLAYRYDLIVGWVGGFDDQLFEEYLRALALNAQITLHVELVYGANRHHALEAMTKSMARALRTAVRIDPNALDIPSTKGVLV